MKLKKSFNSTRDHFARSLTHGPAVTLSINCIADRPCATAGAALAKTAVKRTVRTVRTVRSVFARFSIVSCCHPIASSRNGRPGYYGLYVRYYGWGYGGRGGEMLKERKNHENEAPREGSYAAALNEEQRISLYALLLSGISVAEARLKAPPWPNGAEKDKQPSEPCLWRIRKRLLIEERVRKIESAMFTFRATQKLLNNLVNKSDQEKVLDQAMTLVGQQVIDAGLDSNGPSSKTAAAWLLLRRADQRRFDQRTAIFEAQAAKDKKAGEKAEDAPLPALTEEEKERKWDEIFGTFRPHTEPPSQPQPELQP